jgi:hypothetical protein
MWGEHYCINLGDDSNDEKYVQINYPVALDSRQSIMAHTTTNQKRAGVTQGGIERWRDHRGAWGGGCKSIILAMIKWGVC